MSGLLRGIARTAIISGTATAVSNNVSRRQANRWAAQRPQYTDQPDYAEGPAATAVPAQADPIAMLTKLGELHKSGVLTDEEFAQQKARILA